MYLLLVLKRFQTQLGFVFACYVSANGVVAGKGARTERTGHSDALMPLTDVRAQVRLVTVQPLAERTLQLLSCNTTTHIWSVDAQAQYSSICSQI